MKKSIKWIYIVFLHNILVTSAHKLSGPYFECGPHGRFEYCIDGIPGCVVGCHCHPGYYFDTETKVCEANNRLRLDYRRQYQEEPTPTYQTTTDLSPTPTTTSMIDKNVDAIAKDADDLGDWLYNQFFKTIENQVINKTSEENKITRRSGSDTISENTNSSNSASNAKLQSKLSIQRRSRRRHGKRSSKKRHSKKALRRKLLRISEDDSLFDSISSSSSSGSSSSSSSSESCENSDSKSREKTKSHGHGRKILMINKKPVPLPSFIFMPNMDTPFFPPLGLPPPPALPMYPMVPVPPMIPFQILPQATTTGAPHTTDPPHTTDHPHTTDQPHTAEPSRPTESPQTSSPDENKPDNPDDGVNVNEDKPVGRSGSRKFRKQKWKGNGKARGRGNFQRERFMKRLQDKIKKKYELPTQDNYFPQDYDTDYGTNMYPESMFDEPNQNSNFEPNNQNVNFKYLSQLIHKMNKSDARPSFESDPINVLGLNQNPNTYPNPNHNFNPNVQNSKISPNINTNPNMNSNTDLNSKSNPNLDPNSNSQHFKTLSVLNDTPSRRSGNKNNAFINNFTKKDNYADLGRQIAALVRKIDTKGDRQIDVQFEEEKTISNIPPQALFNDNGFSSRSYWERFARSPFKIRFDTDRFITLDSSEQLQLLQLSLEDQVNNAATTPRILTLQQLENTISLMQKIKSIHNKQANVQFHKSPTKLKLPIRKLFHENITRFDMKHEKENVTKSFFYQAPFQNYDFKTTRQPSYKNVKNRSYEASIQNLVYAKTRQPVRNDNLFNKSYKTPIQDTNSKKSSLSVSRENVLNISSTTLNVTYPENIPRGLNNIPRNPKLFNYSPQMFKIPLSPLLQHAVIHPSKPELINRNLKQYLKPKTYSNNPLHTPKVKKLNSNKEVYHHHDNIVQVPSFFLGSPKKPTTYFHHHFDNFDENLPENYIN